MVDSILIGGNQTGLERDVEPWLLPNGAYPLLENAFIRREKVKRKRGFEFFGRLRRVYSLEVLTQTTSASLVTTITDLLADTAIGVRSNEPNGEIVPGSVVISVADGNPSTWNDATTSGVMSATGGNASDGSINYVSGEIVLNFAIADAGGNAITLTFAYYPTLPVMGIRTRENPLLVNREQTIAFDTSYAYSISGGEWVELPSSSATTWLGNDYQFFYTTNFQLFGNSPSEGVYFIATNFNYNASTPANSDPIRYYNNATWADLLPATTSAQFLLQGRLIIPYKGRLLILNTVEGTQADFGGTNRRYPQRARWSQIGDFTTSTAWRSDISGRGGFIDAPTGEAIVGAEFLKDNLVVYFERSSWLLDYTGDLTLPFIWKRINKELGAEGTFSTWSFDDYAVGVGATGIHICNGSGTTRFDKPIPDEIFKFQNNNNGNDRIYAIRDWWNELLYISYPQSDSFDPNNDDQKFSNRVLVFNYENNTWAKNIDSFTCYGYYQRTSNFTWASATYPWSSASGTWAGEITNQLVPIIMAGNQQGFTFIQNEFPQNEKTLAIQGLSASTVTSANHNLVKDDYIVFEGILGSTGWSENTVYQVTGVTDADNFTINTTFSGTYLGAGTVKVLHNFRIATKRFNPYLKQMLTARVSEVYYFLDRTSHGEFEAQLLINESTSIPMPIFSPFNKARQTRNANIIRTRPEANSNFQRSQEKIWHVQKYSGDAQFLQISITLTDEQMQDIDIQSSDFVMHAILFKVTPSGRLYQ